MISCLCLLLAFSPMANAIWQETAVPGKLAPDFILPAIKGGKVRLKDFCGSAKKSGKKAVIIMFFAEWCEICHDKEIPDLIELQKDAKIKDKVQVLAISIDKELNREKYKKMALPFPVLSDRFIMLAPRYGFTKMLPMTVLISPDGRVVKIWEGYNEEIAKEMKSGLAKIIENFSKYQ